MNPLHDRQRERHRESRTERPAATPATAVATDTASSPHDAVGNAARVAYIRADPNNVTISALYVQGQVSNAAVARAVGAEGSLPNGVVSGGRRVTGLDEVAGDSQALAGLQMGEMQIALPPSVTAQSLFLPFTASSTISKSRLETALSRSPTAQLSAAQKTDKKDKVAENNSDKDNAQKNAAVAMKNALGSATQYYRQTTQGINRQHDDAISTRNQAVQRLAFAYDNAVQQTLLAYQQSDAHTGDLFSAAESSVIAAAANADRSIVSAYRRARRLLFGTAAWARGAVNNNARTAQTQINTIVTDLSASYTSYLDTASQDCDTAGTEATRAVEGWERALPRRYPNTGGGMTRAENEAKRLAGEAGANRVIPIITDNTATVKRNFTKSKQQVVSDIRASVYPTLNARALAIATEGKSAVETAFNSAFSSLRRQVRDAREQVKQMQTQAQLQLHEQRQGARAQLEVAAQQSLHNTHSQVERATRGLLTSTQTLLPNYSAAAQRLAETLLRSAAGGPEALSGAAEESADTVAKQINRAHHLQQRQTDTVVSGTESGLHEGQQQLNQQLANAYNETSNQVNATSQMLSTTLAAAATTMTSGFGSIADGVRSAAESWSKPLAAVFSDYLTRQSGALAEGLPAFQGQVDTSKNQFLDMVRPLKTPNRHFSSALSSARAEVKSKITSAKQALGRSFSAGIFDRIDEGGVTGAVRGLTVAQGDALRSIWPRIPAVDMLLQVSAYHNYSGDMTYNLDIHLIIALGKGSDDYNAAINYINGNTAAGARYELEASLHWYNDEEARIESTMRVLTDAQRQELHNLDGWADTSEEVRDSLDGTDLKVFDAVDEGKHARADLLRMLDRVEHARTQAGGGNGDNDELNTVLAEYSRGSSAAQWGGEVVNGEERRRRIQSEFAQMRNIDLDAVQARNASVTNAEEAASQALFAHVTRNIDVQRHIGQGQTITVRLSVDGAQEDLSRALIFQGEGSPEARAASLGVEAQRRGGPNIVNLDKALVDSRFNPNTQSPDAQTRSRVRTQALQDRTEVMAIFARDYGGIAAQSDESTPQQILSQQLQTAFGDDKAGAFLAGRLVAEEHPSPKTASYAMQYAIDGVGTNNELIDRVMPRMNRDEIATMRDDYRRRTGSDLYADLGVHGHGWFGDLSGDDRLRFERQTLGMPRNDRERAEVAAFTIQQQRNETGWVGSILASGTIQEQFLDDSEAQLAQQLGGTVSFGKDGVPQWDSAGNFDQAGGFQGDAAEFHASLLAARLSSENYAAKIDQYANVAAMGIAIVGAIAAAVASVLTGGAASPLLLAAIAGITGLAAMGAQRAISGGRYGWEQAATDLGMTAVQALTAGLGQGLSLASRGGMAGVQAGMKTGLSISAARQLASSQALGQMGRLTGNAFMDKLVMGMVGGGLGSLGQTALDENTWKKGGAHATDALFAGLFRGVLTGGITAGVTNALEDLPLQGLPGLSRILGDKTLGERVGETTNVLGRSVGKGVTSGIGGAVGRGAELEFERERGTYRGDSGDIFQSMLETGLQQTIQGAGEGATEARAQAIYNRRQQAASARTSTRNTDTEVPQTPRPVSPGEQESAASRLVEAQVDTEALAGNTPTATAARRPRPNPTVVEPAARRLPDMQSDTQGLGGHRPDVDTEAPVVRASTEDLAESDTEFSSATSTRRAAGAAATIADSEMQLAPVRVIADPEVAITRALQEIETLGGVLLDVTVIPNQTGPNRLVEVTRADGEKIRVRIEVGETEGHVASFRPAAADSAEDFVVTLSSRARDRVHARALSHELAELGVHGLSSHAADTDLLRASRLEIGNDPLLSAHDRGRLAELELLSTQLKAIPVLEGQTGGQAQQRLQGEIEALAAHLGLIHTDANDPRLMAALGVLPEASPARTALDQARQRAREVSLDDTLVAARGIDENAQLSAADRRHLARLDELGARLVLAQRRNDAEQVGALRADVKELATRLGLMDSDAATDTRLRIAMGGLEPDSAGVQALNSVRQDTVQQRQSAFGDSARMRASRTNTETDTSPSVSRRRSGRATGDGQILDLGDGVRIFASDMEQLATRLGLGDTENVEDRHRPIRTSRGSETSEDTTPRRYPEGVDITEVDIRPGVRRRRVVDLREGNNDALRPGLKPDERTVPSARDRQKIAALTTKLQEIETQRQQGGASDEQINRLRLQAEALASAMGLIHGEAAEARRQLLLASLNGDQIVVAQLLTGLVESAQGSALLQPRMGTVEDLPLLARQIEQAQGMGDRQQASELMEIAGFRLEAAGFLDAALQSPQKLQEMLNQTFGDDTATRQMVGDALERHRARRAAEQWDSEATSVRVNLAEVEARLADAERRLDAATAAALPEKGKPRPARERERDVIAAEVSALRAQHPQRITDLQTEHARLTAAAASAARVAFRPQGTSVDNAVAAAMGDSHFPVSPRLRTDPDYPGNPTQQRLTRQRYGDSAEFQSWERFRDLYFGLNPSVREHQQGVGIQATGEIKAYGAEELNRVFAYWRSGEYVDQQTGQKRGLSDLERIRARDGRSVYGDNNPAPTVLGTESTAVPSRQSGIVVSAEATQRQQARQSGKLLVSEAEQQRREARVERRALVEDLTQAQTQQEQADIKAKIKRLDLEINDLSESLGVAAGRRFGSTLVDESELIELHGARVPDLIHADEDSGRVTAIECKGGESQLGERRATVGGRAVMAEQATPENLRSLAMDMLNDSRPEVRDLATKILKALNQNPINVDMYVVRQPFGNNDQIQPIEVTRYPMNRDGR